MKLPELNILKQGNWHNNKGQIYLPPRLVLTFELEIHKVDYGEIIVNQQTYAMTKNTVLFKRPGDIVQHKMPNYKAQCDFIYFTLEALSPQFEHILTKIPTHTIADEKFLSLWEKLTTEYSADHPPELEIQSCMTLISILLLLSSKESLINSPSPLSPHQTMLFRAVCYMREHLTENISINDVATYIGYSPSRFNYLFKSYTSRTPYAYFTFLRMCEAKNLLLNTSQTIASIAETLNFKNASKFSEAFKRECNLTPVQFRKMREPVLYW